MNQIKLTLHLANAEPELQKIILELLSDIQDHQIQDSLFKELITNYATLAKTLEGKIHEITLLSETDPLTKAFNRNKLYKTFPFEEKRAKRHATPLSIILFDIDHFKKVNDNFGHDIGDQVLILMADIAKATIRNTDLFVRWGGEEFIILTLSSLTQSMELAERLRQNIMNYEFPQVQKVTCSFGVAEYLNSHDTLNTLTIRADSALYEAKQSGRNRVCFRMHE